MKPLQFCYQPFHIFQWKEPGHGGRIEMFFARDMQTVFYMWTDYDDKVHTAEITDDQDGEFYFIPYTGKPIYIKDLLSANPNTALERLMIYRVTAQLTGKI